MDDKLFVYGLIITAWLVPLTIISICYLRVSASNSLFTYVERCLNSRCFLQIFVYTKGTRAKINHHNHFDHPSPSSSLRVGTSEAREMFQCKTSLMHSEMFVVSEAPSHKSSLVDF